VRSSRKGYAVRAIGTVSARLRGFTALLALLLLAACGDLPQPFRGQPGAVGALLARPPAYRLAVPPPPAALLSGEEAETYARLLANSLQANDIPAIEGAAWPLDWRVEIVANREGGQVVPRYTVRDADGNPIGELAGRPVALRDWAEGGEPILRRAASDAAPQLATLIARADARRRTGDEAAAGTGGPPVILLRPVRGAPGDGNESLTARMTASLAALGFAVQEQAQGAGFAVEGVVSFTPVGRGLERVEIVWTVSRRDGYDLGRVAQLNEVPAGSLTGMWADVAFVVAEEAAGGVKDVIANAGGLPPPAEAARPGQPPASAPVGRAGGLRLPDPGSPPPVPVPEGATVAPPPEAAAPAAAAAPPPTAPPAATPAANRSRRTAQR
jgi:hypothetical protein